MSLTLNTKVYNFTGWIQGAIARYLNAGDGTATGANVATCRVEEPNVNGDLKVRWKLQLPTVVSPPAVGAPGGITRKFFADIVITCNQSATAAERDNMSKSLKDLCATPEFLASINSLQTPSS